MSYLIIGIGGALGAISRYGMGLLIVRKSDSQIPLSTFIINIVGSFVLGLVLGLYNKGILDDFWQQFLGIGFCGAFTTFSTFGYETIKLIENKQPAKAVIYVMLTTFLSVIGGYIGWIV